MKLTDDLAWRQVTARWRLTFQHARKMNEIAPRFLYCSQICPELFNPNTEQGKKHYDLLMKAFEEGNYEALKPLIEFAEEYVHKSKLRNQE